jgi:hypothetical protein
MANRLGWLKIALKKAQKIRKKYEKQYEKYCNEQTKIKIIRIWR